MAPRAGLKEGPEAARPGEVSPGTRPSESEPVPRDGNAEDVRGILNKDLMTKQNGSRESGAKGTGNKGREKPDSWKSTEQERTPANRMADTGLMSSIETAPTAQQQPPRSSPVQNWAKDLNISFLFF